MTTIPHKDKKVKFLIYSYYGEILDLAITLKNKGHLVKMYIQSDDCKKIGDGIVEKVDDWYSCIGQDFIWVFDGCENGKLQDWLRGKGEFVCGGSEKGDKLENNRQLGQAWFKKAGFHQSESHNFTSIDEALAFVKENTEKRWILKQNGDAPKSINHMGKFSKSEDMIYHLEDLKKSWSDIEYGKFDCDLMEVVEGMEIAASVFFNGKDFLKNKDGKVVGYLNWEEKKEIDGNIGETTGEMGTTFMGVTEDNKLFKDIIMRPEIIETLRKIGFRGVFDINGCWTKDGYVAFEPTMRFGVPSTAYEFCEAMENPDEVLIAMAKGEECIVKIKMGFGMVMVVAAKPYPIECDVEDIATSLGERLWILKDGKPVSDFSDEQKQHIHLYNFEKSKSDDEAKKTYKVVTKCGYLLTVTASGKDIESIRNDLIEYIKSNLYISGIKYRSDIGKRVEKYIKEKKDKKEQEKVNKDSQGLRDKLKDLIYG